MLLNELVVQFCKLRNSGDQLHNFGSVCNITPQHGVELRRYILC